ncbi:MAG: zinc-dependent metalloprotease [Pseudomonadota bacterium]
MSPMLPSPIALKRLSASIMLALTANAFAQEPAPPVAPAAPVPGAPGAPGAPAAERPDPAAPKAFRDVVKGATEKKGYFTLHQRDEKVWIEIRPEQFGQPFFFTQNVTNGVGERGLYGSQMGGSHVAVFKKIGNVIQLIAKNMEYMAAPGTPQARAVAQGFSDSLIASAPVASAANPANRAVLVEANALLFSDIPAYATHLEMAYRMPFALDARNTSFSSVRTDDSMSGFGVSAHYAVPKLNVPPLVPVPSPVPMPTPPTTTPDPRSLFMGFYYSFAPLPREPMNGRKADDRVGHFVTTHQDFTEDLTPKLSHHMVNRWRLEKKDPTAALSDPVTPITYWLDKNIPQKYRASITQGVLEWNQAFERIGFKNAIAVKQQQDGDEFDTLDARHASIRWFVGADVGFAIGPSRVDPRSGEILDADIGMSDVFARGARRFIGEDGALAQAMATPNPERCDFAAESGGEMGFALELMEARGEFDMDSPQADALAQAYVKAVITHEIGHTLGLRHNFRASTIYSLKQIGDSAFTKKNGLGGSVMDYTPFNIAVKGEAQGEYVMSTLGPYDYWAIEYAYKPIAADAEKNELAKIAARSTEPLLAFGTDEDSGFNVSDPDVNTFDLGGDPLLYFKKRLTLSREFWDRLQERKVKDGESYDTLRRSFEYSFGQFARIVPVAAKFVGGVSSVRDHAGSERAAFTPVAAARQREALALITKSLFQSDSFKFSPGLVSRLAGDRFDRHQRGDVSIAGRVMGLQTFALDMLLNDGVAMRLLDSQEKVADPKKALGLAELYDNVQTAVWSELKNGKDISASRRNLQREHLKRIANTLLRPAPSTPADAHSLQRENALALHKAIHAAMGKPMSAEARAHLAESFHTLDEALKAPLARTGV